MLGSLLSDFLLPPDVHVCLSPMLHSFCDPHRAVDQKHGHRRWHQRLEGLDDLHRGPNRLDLIDF